MIYFTGKSNGKSMKIYPTALEILFPLILFWIRGYYEIFIFILFIASGFSW